MKVETDSAFGSNEIRFNVFAKKPAIASRASYPIDRSFRTTAFMLPSGKSWNADKTESAVYIDDAIILYNSAAASWFCQDSIYYWPKSASLTFMSYAPWNIGAVCNRENGVELLGYDAYNAQNVDFMVADIAKDKNANESMYGYTGVPTLFRHKMTRLSFRANLNAVVEDSPEIIIKNLRLLHIYTKGDYTKDSWPRTSLSTPMSYESGSGDIPPQGLKLEVVPQKIFKDYIMVIPQNLYEYSSPDANVDRPAPLIYVAGTWNGIAFEKSFAIKKISEQWIMGQDITYTLSFSVKDEYIEFDSDVRQWDDTGGTDIQIGE